MINALHSEEQQDDLPLLTEKAARLRKKALPGLGGYLQRNLQSEFPHLTGAPILCQPGFVSHYLLSPPSPELHPLSQQDQLGSPGCVEEPVPGHGQHQQNQPGHQGCQPHQCWRGSLVLSSHFSCAEKSRL